MFPAHPTCGCDVLAPESSLLAKSHRPGRLQLRHETALTRTSRVSGLLFCLDDVGGVVDVWNCCRRRGCCCCRRECCCSRLRDETTRKHEIIGSGDETQGYCYHCQSVLPGGFQCPRLVRCLYTALLTVIFNGCCCSRSSTTSPPRGFRRLEINKVFETGFTNLWLSN